MLKPIFKSASLESPKQTVAFSKYAPIGEKSTKEILKSIGFLNVVKIADALQGVVFKAEILDNTREDDEKLMSRQVVIKQTDKHLSNSQRSRTGINENIENEARILKYITEQIPTNCAVNYLNLFHTDDSYFLVMEYGGQDLFEFVIEAHKKIAAGTLPVRRWRKYVKYFMWQICLSIHSLHTNRGKSICHLDISLENLLINNCQWIWNKKSQQHVLNPNAAIKLCDFGLAEMFNSNTNPDSKDNFNCSKLCGKLKYMSPEIIAKQAVFQANKSDIWSLGVVFFSIAFGAMPYSTPDINRDDCYRLLINGNLFALLKHWKCLKFISKDMMDLMTHMLDFNEKSRYDIEQIINHPWFALYLSKYNTLVRG